MKTIKSIEVNKIKGIENERIELNVVPNKPNIIVAPNGYGKSSITAAFSSLKQTRLKVEKDNLHNGKEYSDSYLKVNYKGEGNDEVLIANSDYNKISEKFDVSVINSHIIAKSKKYKIDNITNVKSNLAIKDIELVSSIPENIKIDYNFSNIKKLFNPNGKVAINIDDFINNDNNVITLYEYKEKFKNLSMNIGITNKINKFLDKLKSIDDTSNNILSNLTNDKLTIDVLEDKNIIEIINDDSLKNYFTKFNSCEKAILIIELINIYKANKDKIIKIYKRAKYNIFNNKIKDTLSRISKRSDTIKIIEHNNKLMAIFPDANMLSNGERDIFSLILLLEKHSFTLSKKNNIFIIDEVFDYLDDINLIIAQWYISNKILEFKNKGREIYIMLMTHLDPVYFNSFVFRKMNIQYLYKKSKNVNESLKKIIINRDEYDKEEYTNKCVSKYYLHYHYDDYDINNSKNKIDIDDKFNTSNKLKKEIYEELDKYVDYKNCDYLMVAWAIRIKIEEYFYYCLDDISKEVFIKTNETKNKIKYAENCDIEFPDIFKSLGLIYNEALHVHNSKKLDYILIKLDNSSIHNIICELVSFINNNLKKGRYNV